MKFLFALALILTFSLGANAQTKNIDYTKSAVSFVIKNAGLKVDGHFSSYTATLVFDPTNLATTHIEAEIKTTSITTGINGRDNHLRKEEFFNVAKYPSMSFKVTSLKKVSAGNYMLFGKLTMKDVSKEVSMPMTVKTINGIEVFEATLQLNRQDYHVGENSWVMSDDVAISIKIATK